jgi:uncharacterized OB-fold protein
MEYKMSLFCKHIWEEKERFNVTRHYTYYDYLEPNHLLIILKCKKCGKLKRFEI